MEELIKYWYADNFPNDDLGVSLRHDITFQDCLDFLDNPSQFDFEGDFYKWIGVEDSVIRELIFTELAYRMDVDKEVIYDMWLNQ